jgi:hypothetical protein
MPERSIASAITGISISTSLRRRSRRTYGVCAKETTATSRIRGAP